MIWMLHVSAKLMDIIMHENLLDQTKIPINATKSVTQKFGKKHKCEFIPYSYELNFGHLVTALLHS